MTFSVYLTEMLDYCLKANKDLLSLLPRLDLIQYLSFASLFVKAFAILCFIFYFSFFKERFSDFPSEKKKQESRRKKEED